MKLRNCGIRLPAHCLNGVMLLLLQVSLQFMGWAHTINTGNSCFPAHRYGKTRDEVIRQLVAIQYERNDINMERSRFRVRGDVLEIYPAYYTERAVRVEFFGDEIERIREFDTLTGDVLCEREHVAIFPASHFVTPRDILEEAIVDIRLELEERLAVLRKENKLLEAQRLEQRTKFDLEMMSELGYCSGIENYSRHLDRRPPGSRPYTLLDYFPRDYLLLIDESHRFAADPGHVRRGPPGRKYLWITVFVFLPPWTTGR